MALKRGHPPSPPRIEVPPSEILESDTFCSFNLLFSYSRGLGIDCQAGACFISHRKSRITGLGRGMTRSWDKPFIPSRADKTDICFVFLSLSVLVAY